MAKEYGIKVVVKGHDQLSGPLGRMGASIRRFTAGSGTSLGGMKPVIGSLVGALGVHKIGSELMRWSEGADEVGKSAFKLGVGTKQLQEFRRAARMADLDIGDFNKSVNMMSRRMGAARVHSGALYADLKKHAPGLLKQAMATKNNGEALELFMKALDQTTKADERAALANTLFGRSGGVMVAMIQDGYEAFRKYREEADSFGLLTDENIKSADEFDKGMKRLGFSIDGVKNELGGRLLPLLQPLIDRSWGWISANRELIASELTVWISKVGTGLESVGAWLNTHKSGLWDIFTAGLDVIKTVSTTLDTLMQSFQKLPDIVKGVGMAVGVALTAVMSANPKMAMLLEGAIALQYVFNRLDKRQQRSLVRYAGSISAASGGESVVLTPETQQSYIEKKRVESETVRAQREYEATHSIVPPDENVLTEDKLRSIIDASPVAKARQLLELATPGGVAEVGLKFIIHKYDERTGNLDYSIAPELPVQKLGFRMGQL